MDRRPIRTLVVDDDHDIAELVQLALSDEGYEVVIASNGSAALQATLATPFDLILLDLRMPVMDGRQLAAALARRRPSLPIVFMSGFTAQLMDLRLVSPHLAFLAKPFRNEDLLAAVRGQLER